MLVCQLTGYHTDRYVVFTFTLEIHSSNHYWTEQPLNTRLVQKCLSHSWPWNSSSYNSNCTAVYEAMWALHVGLTSYWDCSEDQHQFHSVHYFV